MSENKKYKYVDAVLSGVTAYETNQAFYRGPTFKLTLAGVDSSEYAFYLHVNMPVTRDSDPKTTALATLGITKSLADVTADDFPLGHELTMVFTRDGEVWRDKPTYLRAKLTGDRPGVVTRTLKKPPAPAPRHQITEEEIFGDNKGYGGTDNGVGF